MTVDRLKADGPLSIDEAVELYMENHRGFQRGKQGSNPYFSPELKRIPKDKDRDLAVGMIYHKLEKERRERG